MEFMNQLKIISYINKPIYNFKYFYNYKIY